MDLSSAMNEYANEFFFWRNTRLKHIQRICIIVFDKAWNGKDKIELQGKAGDENGDQSVEEPFSFLNQPCGMSDVNKPAE